jgi:hypothetical protein
MEKIRLGRAVVRRAGVHGVADFAERREAVEGVVDKASVIVMMGRCEGAFGKGFGEAAAQRGVEDVGVFVAVGHLFGEPVGKAEAEDLAVRIVLRAHAAGEGEKRMRCRETLGHMGLLVGRYVRAAILEHAPTLNRWACNGCKKAVKGWLADSGMSG